MSGFLGFYVICEMNDLSEWIGLMFFNADLALRSVVDAFVDFRIFFPCVS